MADIPQDDDLIGFEDATLLLGVTAGELWAIVRDGLLTPVDEQDHEHFRRRELVAFRDLDH